MSKKKKKKDIVCLPTEVNDILSEELMPSECFLLFKENIPPMLGIVLSGISPFTDKVICMKYDLLSEKRGKFYDITYTLGNPNVGYFNVGEPVILGCFDLASIDVTPITKGDKCAVTWIPSDDMSCIMSEVRFDELELEYFNCNAVIDMNGLDDKIYLDVIENVKDFYYYDLDFSNRSILYTLNTATISF
jgi:hypothetical protein